MSWTTARTVLDARMDTLPSLGTSQIEWPNEPFDAQTALYYRVSFLPTTVNPPLYGGADHEQGIYQVSVFAPTGGGLGPALEAAQAVADHFKRQNLSGVYCGVPKLGPPLQEPGWLHLPVSIPFLCL